MLIVLARLDGFPALVIEEMDKADRKFIRDLMMFNRVDSDEVLVHRSKAGAHLSQWDSILGTATIMMHGESIDDFISYIESAMMVRVHNPEQIKS
jgi:hypothetical protein